MMSPPSDSDSYRSRLRRQRGIVFAPSPPAASTPSPHSSDSADSPPLGSVPPSRAFTPTSQPSAWVTGRIISRMPNGTLVDRESDDGYSMAGPSQPSVGTPSDETRSRRGSEEEQVVNVGGPVRSIIGSGVLSVHPYFLLDVPRFESYNAEVEAERYCTQKKSFIRDRQSRCSTW